MRIVNERGLNLIKSFEGLRLSAYRDTKGRLTIGYGHTKDVQEGQTITEDQANTLLLGDLAVAEIEVQTFIRVPLSDNQFSALVCLVFNTGPAPLQHHLGLKLNAGDYLGASNEFPKWNHCFNKKTGVLEVVEGLTDRREVERNLFNEGD